jgi:molybdate transport system substrate-binding protein
MADKVTVAFTVPLGAAIRYPIAKTTAAANPREAKSFIDYVLSPAGQAILARYGFQKP